MSDHLYHEIVELCCDACMSCRDECKEAHGYCRDCDEYLCKPCFDSHLLVRVARDHVLLENSEMPKERPRSVSSKNGSDDEQSMECRMHPNNDIQLFCEYHNVLCCSVCTAVNHTNRMCRVQYIPDIAKEITENGQLSSTESNLRNVIKQTKEAEENVKSLVQLNELQRKNGYETVKEFADTFKTELEKREKELSEQIESRYTANYHRISPVLKKYSSGIAEADKLVNRLDMNRGNENNTHLFIAYYEARAKIDELKSALVETKLNKKIEDFNVTCDPHLIKLIEDPATVSYENVEKQQTKPITKGRSKRTPFQPRMMSPIGRNREVYSEYLQPVTSTRNSTRATLMTNRKSSCN
ncbi:transcription intermediary factor 1-alpha-like [Mercenaria mercenaria]|uniref:transcription intermediary factor 1-alpha-like n=1 Tax=Mercenaria mercenaria TaxID=6596 RepID=UPI00234E6571|nr:transcription intermediary factor 1-alpha-like [Mercenaria mercenaria]